MCASWKLSKNGKPCRNSAGFVDSAAYSELTCRNRRTRQSLLPFSASSAPHDKLRQREKAPETPKPPVVPVVLTGRMILKSASVGRHQRPKLQKAQKSGLRRRGRFPGGRDSGQECLSDGHSMIHNGEKSMYFIAAKCRLCDMQFARQS